MKIKEAKQILNKNNITINSQPGYQPYVKEKAFIKVS